MITHPRRRATDFPSETPSEGIPGRPTVSLVIPLRKPGADLSWLAGHVPVCVGEVILVGAPAGRVPDLPPMGTGPAPRLVELPVSGPEALLHTGLTAATGDFLVLIEADGSMSPLEIPHYLHYLESGFDFVKASRFIAGGSPAGYPLVRRLGHRFLLAVARFLYGQRLTDLWYGFCAFRRGFVTLLDPSGDGMELDVEVVTHALHYGLRIAEVPSRELPRRDRRNRRHTLHEGARILQALIAGRPRSALLRLVAVSNKTS